MKYFLITGVIITILFSSPFAPTIDAQNNRVGPSINNTSGKLQNPLKYESIQQLVPALLDIATQIGLVICTFFIIYAGFKYVTARGNSNDIEKAHSILLWSVVGTAVLLGAKVLASILANTVDQIVK